MVFELTDGKNARKSIWPHVEAVGDDRVAYTKDGKMKQKTYRGHLNNHHGIKHVASLQHILHNDQVH